MNYMCSGDPGIALGHIKAILFLEMSIKFTAREQTLRRAVLDSDVPEKEDPAVGCRMGTPNSG